MGGRKYGGSSGEYTSLPPEYSIPPREYSDFAAEYPSPPEEFGSGTGRNKAETGISSKKRRNDLIAAILALTLTASIGTADYRLKHDSKIPAAAVQTEGLPSEDNSEASEPTAIPDDEITAPEDPEPADAFNGTPAAEILTGSGLWDAGDMQFKFMPNGKGSWIIGDTVGVFDWAEEDDGSVSFDGYTYDIVEDEGTEENKAVSSYDEKQLSGQISINRPVGKVSVQISASGQNLALESRPNDTDRTAPGIYGWLSGSTAQQLGKGIWLPSDGKESGIQSISFSEDGTVVLQIDGKSVEGRLSTSEPKSGTHELKIVNGDEGAEAEVFSYVRRVKYTETVSEVVSELVVDMYHEYYVDRTIYYPVTRYKDETVTVDGGIIFIIRYGRDLPELIISDPIAGEDMQILRRFEVTLPDGE